MWYDEVGAVIIGTVVFLLVLFTLSLLLGPLQ